jgi:hypothetical protein
MIKTINNKPAKDEPLIGDTFLYVYYEKEHLILRHYSGYASLTDPETTWDLDMKFSVSRYGIKFVDVELKII